MKEPVIIFVALALAIPVLIFMPVVMSGGLMLKESKCIYLHEARRNPGDVEISLLNFGEMENLVTRNNTAIARKIGRNESLVEVEYQFRRIFPTYKIRLDLYDEHSNSISIYGRQELNPTGRAKFEKLQEMLEADYGLIFRGQNDGGYCDDWLDEDV